MELQNHLFTVSELNQVIKNVLESSFFEINLEGEISNFRPAASGHWYFSLKDRSSSISAVMFKNNSYAVNFKPSDGMKVKVKGKLSLYSQRGTYQIICSELCLFGEGDILMMLEKRKRELASKGLFDPSRKKILPRLPKTIGIVTSPTGAALQDILKVIYRRHCISKIIILPTLVQGNNAHKNIAMQIDKANRCKLCDLIILARGGGSLEDLLPFSEESVVYSIFNSEIPIITGIGHEIDTSLSDLAADTRAATPSAAAEIVTEESQKLYTTITTLKNEMLLSIQDTINSIKNRLSMFSREQADRELRSRISNYYIHLDNLKNNIITTMKWKIESGKSSILNAKKTINAISPYTLFDRGYAWVTKNGESIMNKKLSPGDELDIKYRDGEIISEVKEIK